LMMRDSLPQATRTYTPRPTPTAPHTRRPWHGLGALIVVALLSAAMTGCSNILSDPTPPTAASGTTAVPNTTAAQDYNAAQNFSVNHQCVKAIPLYLSALIKNSIYVYAYLGLGDCYQSMGALDLAIQAYDKAVTLDPKDFYPYYQRAGAEINSGDHGDATTDLFLALVNAPQQVLTYQSIAARFDTYQDFSDEIQVLGKAIDLAPENAPLYQQRAKLYLQIGEVKHAYDDYTTAIQITTNPALRAALYSGEADVYASQQRFDPDAYGAIYTALALQPGDANIYLHAGDLYQSNGDYQTALSTYYDKALTLTRTPLTLEKIHESKGDTYVKMGQLQTALGEYRRASRLIFDAATQGHLSNKIAGIADTYSSQQQFDLAEQASVAAIAVQPNNASLYLRAGTILATAQRYTAALARYNQALQHATLLSDREQIHEAKGDVYASLGQTTNARDEYNQAKRLTQDPDTLAGLDNKTNALTSASTK